MRKAWMCVLALTAATAGAQVRWDVGVLGGYGFDHDLTVKNASASATAGLANGAVFGVYGGEDMYRYWSGEVNYLYRRDDLRLSNSSVSESFDAHSHILTGDILAHFRPRESRIRPFLSFGAGLRIIVGSGNEGLPQPLGASCFNPNPNCFAALTATRQVQILGAVGAGVKIQLVNHLKLRLQVKDYLTGRPDEVIAPGPGAKMTGFPNSLIGTVSVGYTW